MPQTGALAYNPPPHPLDIVYLDATLLVLNKPSGLLSVPGRGEAKRDCLATRVQEVFPEALVVHRLDMETSGLMIMARTQDMHRRLSRMFEKRQVEKGYIALVAGRLRRQSGVIDLPLICDWPNRPRQMVDLSLGKAARTRYRVMEFDPAADTTRVELKPETGRTHQLRVHMLALGHPIVGDSLYGNGDKPAPSDRLRLHASALSFCHPHTGEMLELGSPTPF